MKLVGRNKEKTTMLSLLSTEEPEMLAIIGRRRVGKTFLIREVYKEVICFEMTGVQDALKDEQLYNFSVQLKEFTGSKIDLAVPENWLKAFNQLTEYLKMLKTRKKKVIFFDELPWLASHRSGFLQALGYFWNNWAVKQNILVVICGSAASWMINKVVNHKGGLHNRITKLIQLEPFTLGETEEFLKSKNINLNHYQIVQIYMAMGGIPHYLKNVRKGLSAAQTINEICFHKNGLLKNEFQNLYAALFNNPHKHINIIRVLASKWKGLTRSEIVEQTKLSDGGSLTHYLEELTTAGFISQYQPFAKLKKDTLYRLTDEYSLFYLKFIEKQQIKNFEETYPTQTWKSWSGFAFESICIKHVEQIKKVLGISGILTNEASFVKKGDKDMQGLQIDMLIDRKDANINICEMKFYNAEFTIDAAYAKRLRDKISGFREASKTRKHTFLTMITTFGVKENEHSIGLVDHDIKIEALFE
jgi:uncharacterized protein